MIGPPICFKRGCKHYQGIAQPDGTELSECPVCRAFPDGIPEEILDGTNDHSEPLPEQTNIITYEKETDLPTANTADKS